MPSPSDPDRRMIHIGPGADPVAWSDRDDRDDRDDEGPTFLIEEARERLQRRERSEKESVRLARRLVLAFVAVMILAVSFHIVMPAFGLYLPPVVPILCYGAIAAGAIMTARDQG